MQKGYAQDPAKGHLVARWCFESGHSSLDDTAPAGQVNDQLQPSPRIVFDDGIARFPAGMQGAGLQVQSSDDLARRGELTLWVRLRTDQHLSDTIRLVSKGAGTWQNRSYALYLVPHPELDHRFVIGGQVSQDGMHWVETMDSDGEDAPPLGLWVQLALVVRSEGSHLAASWYYRTEHTGGSNPWILVGESGRFQSIFASDSPLVIGTACEGKTLSTGLWLDEVKLYDRALSIEELNHCWPILGTYPEIPDEVPGTVVDHSPKSSGVFLGSPAIVIMPDGTYVAKADYFGSRTSEFTSMVYHSHDKGNTWERIAVVNESFWTSIFYHQGALYMMGTDAGHSRGQSVIRRSDDGGYTWTTPTDEHSGRLFEDTPYHTAPMQVIIHNGRIWRTMEDEQGEPRQHWGTRFRAFMMSAPVDADLLQASSWTASDRIGYNPAWLDGRFRGWLEGNAVVDPDGNIVNILRVDYRPEGGKAAMIRVDADGKQSFFDPRLDFIDLPGGAKKFYILYDETSGLYWALSNPVLPKHAGGNLERAREYVRQQISPANNPGGRHAFSNPERTRNALTLMTSGNLRDWKIRDVVLYHPEISKHGFQYPHFIFDGDDIVFLSRTAYEDGMGGADNQHNANFITFHRIENFRRFVSD